MLVATSIRVPTGLTDFICHGASMEDVSVHLLPALAEYLDADSAGFYQVICDGDTLRPGHSAALRWTPESQQIWRQEFSRFSPVGMAPPLRGGHGQAFTLDDWLDFPDYLRSPAYETFWGPLGIHHVLFARLAHSDTESFVFGCHRAAGRRRFSNAEVARVAGVLPMLGVALSRVRSAEDEQLRGLAATVPAFAELTRREREIAADVAAGLANKHIARRRGISVHTVENHLRSIFRKTGLDSRTKLALTAGAGGSYPLAS